MANRNAKAPLSPTEFSSLRHVANGLVRAVPREHKDTLFAMALLHIAEPDGVVSAISDGGALSAKIPGRGARFRRDTRSNRPAWIGRLHLTLRYADVSRPPAMFVQSPCSLRRRSPGPHGRVSD
jgi:hypothetical protein